MVVTVDRYMSFDANTNIDIKKCNSSILAINKHVFDVDHLNLVIKELRYVSLFLSDLKHIFGISVLQFVVTY